jgi:DNA polymerase III epsilon subunit-like protein/ribonuclease PH/predicted RNA-binding protein with RPS1 domain
MKPENGYIVDLAALRVQGGTVVDRFESLVNPGRSIVGHQIHGLSDGDVDKAPTAAEVLTKFAAWVGDAPVVAHNVGFDLPFVLRHMPHDANWQPTAVYDTLELAYELYPDAGSYKLGDLVRFVFGRDHAAAHRAMPDAEATAELFIDLTNGLADRLEKIRTDIAAEIRRSRTDYNRAEQGERLEDIRRQHGIGSGLMDVLTKATSRELVLSENIRIDGRDTTTIRPISVEVGILPRTHGSGLFQRGQTQALTIATLGPSSDVQRLDTISPETEKRYMHHYNFPPYSVGETGFMRGPKRRDIGHGALAQRSLEPVIPSTDEFPYTIRIVSETLESNGSSSMGSVCGSTLALMDAGVPIKAPVSGIAMGLVKEGDDYVILTDIQGAEDHLGDMDFKVAGTREGITGLQMDIKITGVTREIMQAALEQAKRAREIILDKMLEAIPESRSELNENAPRISTVKIDPEKIGMVIGKGGETIRALESDHEVQIDIEEDGTILIYATDGQKAASAIAAIEALTKEPEVGDEFRNAKVVKTTQFGAFVELKKGTDGLLHVSNVGPGRVGHIEDVINRGDILDVLVQEVDKARGRIGLKLIQKHENGNTVSPEELIERAKDAPPREREEERPRGGDRGGRGGRGGRAGVRRSARADKQTLRGRPSCPPAHAAGLGCAGAPVSARHVLMRRAGARRRVLGAAARLRHHPRWRQLAGDRSA